MSITTLITEKDVKANLDRIMPDYERMQHVPIRVSYGHRSATLTGTAFDYALRFELQRRYPGCRDKKWIAESALAYLEERPRSPLPFPSQAPLLTPDGCFDVFVVACKMHESSYGSTFVAGTPMPSG